MLNRLKSENGSAFGGLIMGIVVGAIAWFLVCPLIAKSTGGDLGKTHIWAIAAAVVTFIIGSLSTKK